MVPYIIYGLAHPTTGRIRYVGKSKHAVGVRLRSGYRHSPKVQHWLDQLRAHGLKPKALVLEHGSTEDWKGRERAWIRTLRYDGHRLLNTCAGGNGGHLHAGLPAHLEPLLGRIPDTHIAEKAGLSREAVSYHRAARGIPAASRETRRSSATRFKKGQRPFNKLAKLDGLEGVLGTLSDRALAAKLGVQRTTVERRRRALGIPVFKGPRTWVGNARVTPQIVRRIRAAFRPGATVKLASQYGLSVSAVNRIVTRKTWAHL